MGGTYILAELNPVGDLFLDGQCVYVVSVTVVISLHWEDKITLCMTIPLPLLVFSLWLAGGSSRHLLCWNSDCSAIPDLEMIGETQLALLALKNGIDQYVTACPNKQKPPRASYVKCMQNHKEMGRFPQAFAQGQSHDAVTVWDGARCIADLADILHKSPTAAEVICMQEQFVLFY